MKELAALLQELGYQDVRTYIQSGNVVLRGPTRPGDAIADRYAFRPEIFVVDRAGWEHAIAHNPFPDGDKKHVHFFFCHTPPVQPDTDRIDKLKAESEQYAITDRVLYLYAPGGIGRSKLAAGVERCLGVPVTARNLKTVQKLLEMVQE